MAALLAIYLAGLRVYGLNPAHAGLTPVSAAATTIGWSVE